MRAVGLAAVIVAALAPAAVGQQVPFGASHDASQPVEITSDRLDLDPADRVEVSYDEGGGAAAGTVRRMVATGNVTLSNGEEAAEAERATYDVATGRVEMEGNVLLTQGGNALSSQRLRIDLNAGTGQLEGRVQTIFVPGSRP